MERKSNKSKNRVVLPKTTAKKSAIPLMIKSKACKIPKLSVGTTNSFNTENDRKIKRIIAIAISGN